MSTPTQPTFLASPQDSLQVLNEGLNLYKSQLAAYEVQFDGKGALPDDVTLGPLPKESVSSAENLKAKRSIYQWSDEDQDYPPHLKAIPSKDSVPPTKIFDPNRSANLAFDAGRTTVDFFRTLPAQPAKITMAQLEERNKALHASAKVVQADSVYEDENMGIRNDWYTDAAFGQQHLTGVNPTGVKIVYPDSQWFEPFVQAAESQDNKAACELIKTSAESRSLFVVDNGDYRSIVDKSADAVLTSNFAKLSAPLPRYGCSSVTLFTLPADGKLHPIAIIIDWKGSVEESVTIFNRRLHSSDVTNVSEREDWPWRYAKMCSQVSDWLRHELTVHLVNTHLVEEAIIIATQRNIPSSHIIFKLLQPHWKKTLSLNAAARAQLVPDYINEIAPVPLSDIQTFIMNAYENFDFASLYAPKDLHNRGFFPDQLDDPKFHNCVYARDIKKAWDVLHAFVSSVLTANYKDDHAVRADHYVQGFHEEMRSASGARLQNFPVIHTLAELINVVTMCIHIAAPQHTAINYLQQYYLVFVPNRPGSLARPLPNTLNELRAYQEVDIVTSLPVTDQRDWLFMALIPYLLSSEVEKENNIVTYSNEAANHKDKTIAEAGKVFKKEIAKLTEIFHKYSDEMDDQQTKYHVLDPAVMASAIVI